MPRCPVLIKKKKKKGWTKWKNKSVSTKYEGYICNFHVADTAKYSVQTSRECRVSKFIFISLLLLRSLTWPPDA